MQIANGQPRRLCYGFMPPHSRGRSVPLNVPKRKRECLCPSRIALDLRHMVRHNHGVVTHLFVNAQRLEHVDVAVIGEGLFEIEMAPCDIAEVDVKNLLALVPK